MLYVRGDPIDHSKSLRIAPRTLSLALTAFIATTLDWGISNTKNIILLDVGLRSPNQDKIACVPECFECSSHERFTHRPPMN